jgi:hypothetical protein
MHRRRGQAPLNGLKHPATVIALLALFVALGGGAALASGMVSGRQIANHSIPQWKLTRRAIKNLRVGARGPAGPRGLAGSSATNALAQSSGLVAWTADPMLAAASVVDTSGSIHGASVWLDKSDRISWLAELVVDHGSGMKHGAFAIYDASLHLVARTGDNPAAFQTAQARSWVKLSLTARYTVPASGRYYFVDLLAGTTLPRIGILVRSASVLSGANVLPGGVPRGISAGHGFSAFPSRLINKGTGLARCLLAG